MLSNAEQLGAGQFHVKRTGEQADRRAGGQAGRRTGGQAGGRAGGRQATETHLRESTRARGRGFRSESATAGSCFALPTLPLAVVPARRLPPRVQLELAAGLPAYELPALRSPCRTSPALRDLDDQTLEIARRNSWNPPCLAQGGWLDRGKLLTCFEGKTQQLPIRKAPVQKEAIEIGHPLGTPALSS